MFNNLRSPMKATTQLATALALTRRIQQQHWNNDGKEITQRGAGVLR